MDRITSCFNSFPKTSRTTKVAGGLGALALVIGGIGVAIVGPRACMSSMKSGISSLANSKWGMGIAITGGSVLLIGGITGTVIVVRRKASKNKGDEKPLSLNREPETAEPSQQPASSSTGGPSETAPLSPAPVVLDHPASDQALPLSTPSSSSSPFTSSLQAPSLSTPPPSGTTELPPGYALKVELGKHSCIDYSDDPWFGFGGIKKEITITSPIYRTNYHNTAGLLMTRETFDLLESVAHWGAYGGNTETIGWKEEFAQLGFSKEQEVVFVPKIPADITSQTFYQRNKTGYEDPISVDAYRIYANRDTPANAVYLPASAQAICSKLVTKTANKWRFDAPGERMFSIHCLTEGNPLKGSPSYGNVGAVYYAGIRTATFCVNFNNIETEEQDHMVAFVKELADLGIGAYIAPDQHMLVFGSISKEKGSQEHIQLTPQLLAKRLAEDEKWAEAVAECIDNHVVNRDVKRTLKNGKEKTVRVSRKGEGRQWVEAYKEVFRSPSSSPSST